MAVGEFFIFLTGLQFLKFIKISVSVYLWAARLHTEKLEHPTASIMSISHGNEGGRHAKALEA